MSVLKRAGRWVIGLGTMIAGLTAHGLAALFVLTILVLVLAVLGRGMMRWIISSEERSDRVVRMMLAWRGKTRPSVPGVAERALAHGPDGRVSGLGAWLRTRSGRVRRG
jgi:hypothetical protein